VSAASREVITIFSVNSGLVLSCGSGKADTTGGMEVTSTVGREATFAGVRRPGKKASLEFRAQCH
jgi:hypothetical protein